MGWKTRQQLRDDAFDQFGEEAGFITTTQVDSWLNDGYVLFATQAECLIAYRILDVLEGKVVMPGDFVRLLSIDTGSHYSISEYEEGTNIIVLRPEGEAVETVNVRYIAIPSSDNNASFPILSADTDKTALHANGDLAITQYALGRMHNRDKNPTEAQKAQNEFDRMAAEENVRSAYLRKKAPIRTSAWEGRIWKAGGAHTVLRDRG